MRITQEADYALRIVYCLAADGGILDAGKISQMVGVTDRFTVKILRKLMCGGIVRSHKGALGGYELAEDPRGITLRSVVETIDGPTEITRCLDSQYQCTRTHELKHLCVFHQIFAKINKDIAEKMEKVTLGTLIGDEVDIEDILSKI